MTVIPVSPRLIVSVLTVPHCLPSSLCSTTGWCHFFSTVHLLTCAIVVFLTSFLLLWTHFLQSMPPFRWSSWFGSGYLANERRRVRGGSDPHIFVGRNIPPTLIRWHNVTFHVCSTRGGLASGQASLWLVYVHEFFADFFFSTSLNIWFFST